jgi:hypothetical protein
MVFSSLRREKKSLPFFIIQLFDLLHADNQRAQKKTEKSLQKKLCMNYPDDLLHFWWNNWVTLHIFGQHMTQVEEVQKVHGILCW